MSSRAYKILNLLKTQAINNINISSSPDLSQKENVPCNTICETCTETSVESHNEELFRNDLRKNAIPHYSNDLDPSADYSCLRETAIDESSNNVLATRLSCARRNLFVEDPNDENELSQFESQMTQSNSNKNPLQERPLNPPIAYVDETSNLPSTSKASNEQYLMENESSTKIKLRKVNQSYTDYCESEEELFSSGSGDEYKPDDSPSSSSESSEFVEDIAINNNDNYNEEPLNSPVKKGRKRVKNQNNWKQVKAKRLRNLGQQYTSRTGKIVDVKSMKPACPEKCVLSCSKKFSEEFRTRFFKDYWDLGSLQRQRDFLGSCVEQLILKYRRVSSSQPRKPNCGFYLHDNGRKIRVCKTFLINTLGISEKIIRTVIRSKLSEQGIVAKDRRGKHGNQKRIDEEVLNSVFDHINSIPRIESHYVRKDTNREFIDGGLTIAEMYRDYCKKRSAAKQQSATYDYYAKIFNTKYNIGFFSPKKDQCDLCECYKNASENEKKELENKYIEHLEEKNLSREEKEKDKKRAQDGEVSLAVYDLQAVLPVPVGQSSAFFYKSRLNCYNFTITKITKNNDSAIAFFWHEVFGNRGAIEIGTYVLIYLEEVSKSQPGLDVIFFSDNCMGQQKNRFLIAAYLYAVEHYEIGSITHKFLIRGHTQNEADAIHSIIEKKISLAKKSGPIYVPDQYISIIRQAKKKGKKIEVKEMSFESFFDIKALSDDMGLSINKNTEGDDFKINEVKILQFIKGNEEFQYKTSYKQEEWRRVNFRQRKKSKKDLRDIFIKKAYGKPFQLSENKKKDLLSLVKANLIPAFYRNYFEGILH